MQILEYVNIFKICNYSYIIVLNYSNLLYLHYTSKWDNSRKIRHFIHEWHKTEYLTVFQINWNACMKRLNPMVFMLEKEQEIITETKRHFKDHPRIITSNHFLI